MRPASELLAVLALSGCGAAPPAPPPGPLATPPWTVVASLTPRTAPLGPSAAAADAGAPRGSDVVLACRVLYLEEEHAAGLEPIELSRAWVADLIGARPLLAVPGLTAGARVGRGAAAREWLAALEAGAAGRVVRVADRTVVVPAGATFTLEVGAWEEVEDPLDWLDEFPDRGPIPRRARLEASSAARGMELTLALDDLDPAREAELAAARLEDPGALPGPPSPRDEEVVRREAVRLDAPLERGDTLVVTVPRPFRSGQGRALAFVLESASGEPAAGELEEARAAVARSAAWHEQRTAPFTLDDVEVLAREQALEAFRTRGGRPALLLLASETGARLAEDLALGADDDTLAALSAEVFAEGERAGERAEIELGWRLESSAWRQTLQRALGEGLPPELEAALLRHAGALARFPDVALDALAASPDDERFRARLVEEQRYFLEDSDPSARLRAHGWLVERDAAVAGFDPLGPEAERRAALDAWRAAREAAGEAAEAAEAEAEDGR